MVLLERLVEERLSLLAPEASHGGVEDLLLDPGVEREGVADLLQELPADAGLVRLQHLVEQRLDLAMLGLQHADAVVARRGGGRDDLAGRADDRRAHLLDRIRRAPKHLPDRGSGVAKHARRPWAPGRASASPGARPATGRSGLALRSLRSAA